MSYFYSPSRNTFYPDSAKDIYGSEWPSDGIQVSDEVYQKYGEEMPPIGMVRAAGIDGAPCFVSGESYFYSPSLNAFYPNSMRDAYGSNWPSDAVSVPHDVYVKFASQQPPEGMQRVAGEDGLPCFAVEPQAPASERRDVAINAIDTAADASRSRDQSVGQLLDIEYQQVVEAHGRWYADGYDAAKCPEEIEAWASAEGVTPLQAAQEIAEAAAHREAVIRQVRSIRLAGKAAVRAAANDADFNAIAGPFIDQLNHIGESTIAAA